MSCIYGWYCDGSGLSAPTAHCQPGYYCDGGAKTSTSKQCPTGHKCSGRDAPEPCPSGFYQNELAKPDCKRCPEGYYCNDTTGPVINYAEYIFPTGYYCPGGTEYPTKFPCGLGTFNNITKRRSASDCIPCTGGFACDTPGLIFPVQLCSAGYFCRRSSNSTTPDVGNDANVCPSGHYCPEGKTSDIEHLLPW